MGDDDKYARMFAPHERKFIVDSSTSIKYRGRHKDVGYEISESNFKAESDGMMCQTSWCTYIFLTEEMHEKFKSRINDAPWNCGQTFYRRYMEEHIGCSPELKEKWDRPYYKIGDDFQHLWDNERYEFYNKAYMERHIKGVIDFLLDEESATTKGTGEGL